MATSVKLSDLVPSRFAHLTPPSEENIERIRADLETGSRILLNNPHVFKNEAGKYELLAGHDRAEAARRAGWTEIPVREFRSGLSTDDGVFSHFCKENLLRKDVSKAAVAGEWLRRHPDWSDGKIADESGCTQQYVSDVRAQLVGSGDIQLVVSRVGRDGRTTSSERAPRQPKTATEQKRDTGTQKAPKYDKLAMQRAAREAQAEAIESAPGAPASPSSEGTDEPEGLEETEAGEPAGASHSKPQSEAAWVRSEQQAVLREVANEPWSKVSDFLDAIPVPTRALSEMLPQAIAQGLRPGALMTARAAHAFLSRLMAEVDRKEDSSAAA